MISREEAIKHLHHISGFIFDVEWKESLDMAITALQLNPPAAREAIDEAIKTAQQPERPKGRWVWKHRKKGGFHTYTGLDSMGETHTITVDERHETEEPYCPICGRWNDSQWLDFCPNCGADCRESE